MNRDLKFERYLRQSPLQVWQALTDRRSLARWYLDNNFYPIVGHQFTFHTRPETGLNGSLYGQVLFVDKPHRLVYSLTASFLKQETIVTWTLNAEGDGGTRLLLHHTGFSGLNDDAINVVMKICPSQFLNLLEDVLVENSRVQF